MKNEEYIQTISEKVEDFLDMMDYLRSIYYENFRLKEEIAILKKENQERFDQIMKMSKMSEEGLHNWVNAILDGKIVIK